ncbi:MAG: hypothetical protein DBO99_05360 [gamma proteobacterium symbiont of Ctena orbiculata]|nr:MAG: hypothetical protein DBO99_05360 [gamma proteobacterium symbiont of Ctena orbiculata]
MAIFIDRVHRLPRLWSNSELSKYANLFTGSVVNVSGWKDIDKEGHRYRDYFTNASEYLITNYKEEARGFQGMENEIFLDLESELPEAMKARFDVVFNHTTLEHIYDIHTAFSNLCGMSKDIVILILPFTQQYHSDYGDYWRLTPLAIKRLFEDNDMALVYQSFNNDKAASVYTFSIASKQSDKWRHNFDWSFSCQDPSADSHEPYIGCNAIGNYGHRIEKRIKALFKPSRKRS